MSAECTVHGTDLRYRSGYATYCVDCAHERLLRAARDAISFLEDRREHLYAGECPEAPHWLDQRDPECEACRALDALIDACKED